MKERFLQFLIILSFFSLLFGDIIFVDTDAGGSDNGTNWTDAFTSFQSALDAAVCGDSIWVAAGTYYPSSGYDVCDNSGDSTRYYHFRMIEGAAIYGGFTGMEDPESFDLDDRDFTANETILSGDIGTPGDSTDNCYHIFYHNDIGLTHAAILDGFTVCEANANNQDFPMFRSGGGILNWISCSPTISNTIIRDNSATNGGGIENYYYSSPVLVNVSISYNTSSNYGGGMMNDNNASPSLTNVTIDHNSGIMGGGISNFFACSPVIINSIIADNSASYGGGINNLASSPVLTNVTISNNHASTYGGGMRNTTYSSTASMPVLNNCIIWGNTATNNGNEIYISDGTTTLNYSCYGNESNDIYNNGTFSPDGNCITSNPRFINKDAYDYRLWGISPCVNTGNNTYNSSSTDIRGEGRIQNTTIDMGAYEWTDGTDPEYLVLYVDADATGGNNTGDSWANAYTSLQSALDRALADDEIWVAAGTYYPSSGYDVCDDSGDSTRYYHFRMIEDVAIYGGFSGTEDPESFDLDNRDFSTNETILSADIGTPGSNTDNCYHVFYHNDIGLTQNAVLDGFTVCDGYANEQTSQFIQGGGMYNEGCSPAISNVIFCDNYAKYGGGIYNYIYAAPILTNVIFTQNSAQYKGGGIYNRDHSSPELINVTLSHNSAETGGGMRNDESSSPILTNVTIGGNVAEDGGGIYNSSSGVTLKNSIIWSNTATEDGSEFYISGGTTILNYSCYGNQSNNIYNKGTLTPDGNCITSNPRFVNSNSYDYRIFGFSPCVNTGNNAYNERATDIRGEDRIQYTTIDMGAYEWTDGIDPEYLVLYVDADATGGSNTGDSWANAYTSLQSALNAAASGYEIWVAARTYYPSSGYDVCDDSGDSTRYYHFRMIEGVRIYGGFAGTEDPESFDLDDRDFIANETILSADIGTPGDSSDNCYHVFYHNNIGLTHDAVLDGFTIRDGYADEETSQFIQGGGMYNEGCSPAISNVTFSDNYAEYGGGMYNYAYSSPLMENAIFTQNTAEYKGGGIYNRDHSSPDLANMTLTYNSAETGGGMRNDEYSYPNLINMLIVNNSANEGGGIYNYFSSPVLTNVTISSNSAEEGAGLYNLNSYATTLKNCIIWGNIATEDGNELYIHSGAVTLNYCCYGNESKDVYYNSTFTPDGNCITSNPHFINSSAGNYRLAGVSPCVNTGNNSYNSTATDIRGEDRIQNTTIDMGAYEWSDGTDPQYLLIYVDSDATGGNNTGNNWANAYTSLQSALNRAVSEDTILVAAGTYKPSSGYDLCDDSGDSTRYYHFRMIEGVRIYGGFAGTEDPSSFDLDERDFNANETILSADVGTPGDSSDNCYHVFFHNAIGLTNNAVLDGFTVCDGYADEGLNLFIQGGGMYNYGCSPAISNVTFYNNYAKYGGGMYNYTIASPLLTNVTFTNNSAEFKGGGIYNRNYSKPMLSNVTLSHNSADTGGGMHNDENSSSNLTNMVIDSNSANDGGGIYNYFSSPNLTDVTIANNSANDGAGIFNKQSSPSLTDVTIANNSVDNAGAGMYNEESFPTLTNMVIINNSADDAGGGIRNAMNSAPVLTNVTISGNLAGKGGAMYNSNDSEPAFKNCIIWGNTATGDGSEFYIYSGAVTLNYCCYANESNDIYNNGTFSPDSNCITSDPCFVGAENNPDHPYSIGGTSPCIDAGNNEYCSETYDIRGEGYPRKLVGNTGAEGGTIDMGAYEYNLGSEVPTPVTLTAFTAVAKNGAVQLDWETASEINNARFIIYRNDVSIGSIDGAGTTSEPQHYTFTDNAVVPEINYTYVLADVDYANKETRYEGLAVTITPVNDLLPGEFRLGDAYPNPFNPLTVLPLLLGSEESVKAVLYDCRGNKVRELQNGILPRGKHELCINGNGLATGVYFVRVKMNDITQIKKVVLIK